MRRKKEELFHIDDKEEFIGDPILSEIQMIETDLEYLISFGWECFGNHISSMRTTNHFLGDCNDFLANINKCIKSSSVEGFRKEPDAVQKLAENLIWIYEGAERIERKYSLEDKKVQGDKNFERMYRRIGMYRKQVGDMLEFYFDLVPYIGKDRELTCEDTQRILRLLPNDSDSDKIAVKTIHNGFLNQRTGRLVKRELVMVTPKREM